MQQQDRLTTMLYHGSSNTSRDHVVNDMVRSKRTSSRLMWRGRWRQLPAAGALTAGRRVTPRISSRNQLQSNIQDPLVRLLRYLTGVPDKAR